MISTKWPRLLVVGEPVTPERAEEILVRTNEWWYLSSNDKGWGRAVRALAEEFGMPPEYSRDDLPEKAGEYFTATGKWRDKMGILDLPYLHNDRITSSWVGGPHGWCDWNGRIGCSLYNIGKWPSDEEVTEDWQAIAEAFPFLTLTAQCIDDEGEGALAAEWRVAGGAVVYNGSPTEEIEPVKEEFSFVLTDPYGERGTDLETLRRALARVAAR